MRIINTITNAPPWRFLGVSKNGIVFAGRIANNNIQWLRLKWLQENTAVPKRIRDNLNGYQSN